MAVKPVAGQWPDNEPLPTFGVVSRFLGVRRRDPTPTRARSARCCSGTRCASAATVARARAPRASRRCCTSTTRWCSTRASTSVPVNYALVRIVPPKGVDGRRRQAAVRDHRSARGATAPASAASRTIRRSAWRLSRRPSGLFRDLLPEPSRGRRCATSARRAASSCARSCASCIRDSQKPAIVGNCQGGWAAMMLAASGPDDRGPLVINGAPMSYWGGATTAIPDALLGGLLGGTWLSRSRPTWAPASSTARTWSELREPQPGQLAVGQVLPPVRQHRHRAAERFLEFERWWGGYYLMNARRSSGSSEPLRRQQAVAGEARLGPGATSTCADQAADHRVRVDGRQHHAAAAGLQLDRRRLRQRPRRSRPTAR
jgi:hypothetical protein